MGQRNLFFDTRADGCQRQRSLCMLLVGHAGIRRGLRIPGIALQTC